MHHSRQVMSASTDRTIRLWSLDTGECLAGLDVEAAITCAAATADGSCLVAGDEAGNVHVMQVVA
jgi:hypothetical protein